MLRDYFFYFFSILVIIILLGFRVLGKFIFLVFNIVVNDLVIEVIVFL